MSNKDTQIRIEIQSMSKYAKCHIKVIKYTQIAHN